MAKGDGYVRFSCRSCGKRLKVKDKGKGGEVIPCPRCGAAVSVPLLNVAAIARPPKEDELLEPELEEVFHIDPDRLMERFDPQKLTEDGLPGSEGAYPTVKRPAGDAALGAFDRLNDLDSVASRLHDIDNDTFGQLQRLYRDPELTPRERAAQVAEIGRDRRVEIARVLGRHMRALRSDMAPLLAHRTLVGPEKAELERLKRNLEALRLYARFVLGFKPGSAPGKHNEE
jgi:hypothetical protein